MDQNWSQTVIRKKRPTSKEARSESAVNRALAAGQSVDVSKKMDAGANKHVPAAGINLAKIDADTETLKVKTVDASVAKVIQQARQRCGKTQKELATEICERIQVVTEYESGKAVPNQQVLAKLERALRVKLRGSNLGAAL